MSDKIPIDSFIPDKLGSKEILFEDAPLIGRVGFIEGIFVLIPGFLFAMFGNLIVPFIGPYYILIALMLFGLGFFVLAIKPKYMSFFTWVDAVRKYRSRPSERSIQYVTDGGKPIESISVTNETDTRDLTSVDKVYPYHDVIQREDGSMVSMIELTGSNLDMSDQEIVLSVLNTYIQKISTQLEFDIQFFMPMRSVSLEKTGDLYAKTLESYHEENIQGDLETTFMKEYLQNRISTVDNLAKNAYVRQIYVIVSVSKSEVYQDNISSATTNEASRAYQQLKSSVKGQSEMQSDEEITRKQIRKLNDRVNKVGDILSVGEGNESVTLSHEKMLALLKEFWEGDQILDDEIESFNLGQGIMMSPESVQQNGGDQL